MHSSHAVVPGPQQSAEHTGRRGMRNMRNRLRRTPGTVGATTRVLEPRVGPRSCVGDTAAPRVKLRMDMFQHQASGQRLIDQ